MHQRCITNDGGWHFTDVARRAGLVATGGITALCVSFSITQTMDGRTFLTTSLAPWEAVVEGLKQGLYGGRMRAPFIPMPTACSGTIKRNVHRRDLGGELAPAHGDDGPRELADLDNDGYLDIYFGTGDPQLTRLEPNRFFRNQWGRDLCRSHGPGWFRGAREKRAWRRIHYIDEDGDLMCSLNWAALTQGTTTYNAFYRNLKGNGTTGWRWICAELRRTDLAWAAANSEAGWHGGSTGGERERRGSGRPALSAALRVGAKH